MHSFPLLDQMDDLLKIDLLITSIYSVPYHLQCGNDVAAPQAPYILVVAPDNLEKRWNEGIGPSSAIKTVVRKQCVLGSACCLWWLDRGRDPWFDIYFLL